MYQLKLTLRTAVLLAYGVWLSWWPFWPHAAAHGHVGAGCYILPWSLVLAFNAGDYRWQLSLALSAEVLLYSAHGLLSQSVQGRVAYDLGVGVLGAAILALLLLAGFLRVVDRNRTLIRGIDPPPQR